MSRRRVDAGNDRGGAVDEFYWLDGPEDGHLSRLVRHGRWIALGLLVLLLALRVADVTPVQILRLWGLDLQLQLRPSALAPSPVLVVDVDDRSLAALGQWPLPRRHLVDLLDRLSEARVDTVAINILFSEPDRLSPGALARSLPELDVDLRRRLEALGSSDEALARSMSRIKTVTAVAAASPGEAGQSGPAPQSRIALRGSVEPVDIPSIGGIIENIPTIRAAGFGEGIVNVLPEPDGIYRRVPTVFQSQGTLLPGMAADIARVVLGQTGMLVETPPPFGMTGMSIGPLFLPTDLQGRIWVNTADPQRIPVFSAIDVLEGRIDDAALRGRIVMIGTSAAGVGERVRTGLGGAISGLQFQALAVDTMVSGTTPRRPALFDWLEIVLTAVAGLVLIWGLPRLSAHLKPIAGVALLCLAAAASIYVSLAANALVDPTFFSFTCMVLVTSFVVGDYRTEVVLRRRNDAALKRHDAYIREVIDASFDAIVTIGEDGRIRTATRAARRLLGSGGEATAGQSIAHRFSGAWADHLALDPAGTLKAAAAQPDPIEVSARGATAASIFPTEITLAPSIAGAEQVYILVLRDVSARKAAEETAALSTQRLHDAVDAISDGFALFAPDGTLLRCNDAYRDMLDVDVDEADGLSYNAVLTAFVSGRHVPAEAAGRVEEWVNARLSVFAAKSQRYEMETADGRWYQVDERRTVEGGMVCVYSDITEIKRREVELRSAMERAELASVAKSQFLANMSHELRTPLNAIIGFADMLRAQPFGPLGSDRYVSYADDISGSGSRLLKMIEQILEFARLERLQSHIDESGIDVPAAVLAAVTDLTPAAQDRGVALEPRIEPSLPALRADPQLLYQIIQNLMANAVKFSTAGSTVRVTAGLDDRRRIVLSVVDTGIGIPAELIEHITQPFWQHPDVMTRPHEGVGLGLAIVSGNVEAHDAELSIESVPGEGTTMTVIFPSYRTV